MTDAEREARKLRKHLTDLTKSVRSFLSQLDVEMAKPSNTGRGATVASLANELNYANDQARYFGLGIDFQKNKKVGKP